MQSPLYASHAPIGGRLHEAFSLKYEEFNIGRDFKMADQARAVVRLLQTQLCEATTYC